MAPDCTVLNISCESFLFGIKICYTWIWVLLTFKRQLQRLKKDTALSLSLISSFLRLALTTVFLLDTVFILNDLTSKPWHEILFGWTGTQFVCPDFCFKYTYNFVSKKLHIMFEVNCLVEEINTGLVGRTLQIIQQSERLMGLGKS